MKEFADSLDDVYALAEADAGFLWRIPEDQLALELVEQGYDELTSATVSVWKSYEALKNYTYSGLHGQYLDRSSEWFMKLTEPQLVIWTVSNGDQPSFKTAIERLERLRINGNTENAFSWIN
jgi:hypothetical protein